MKVNLFTMNTTIHFFTWTDKLWSFIYDVQQKEGGHENLGIFAIFNFLGEGSLFFPTYVKFSTIFWHANQ